MNRTRILKRICVLSTGVLLSQNAVAHAPPQRAQHPHDSEAAVVAKAAVRNKQFSVASEALEAAAGRGDVQSQYLLGLMYAAGLDAPPAAAVARRWLEAAADKGHPAAAYALAGLLASGPSADRTEARRWLEQAASEGHPLAAQLRDSRQLPLSAVREAGGDQMLARELLLWAISHHDDALLNSLGKSVPIDSADEFGRTPLAHAAMQAAEPAVRQLLTSGADREHADQYGVTALMLAAEADSEAVLALLLQPPVNLDACDHAGSSALFYAVRAGRTGNVQHLLEAGASITVVNADGWTALDVALRSSHPDAARSLASAGAVAHTKAVIAGESAGLDPTRPGELYRGWPPLAVAASRSDRHWVSELLSRGARPDEPTPQGDTALLIAVKNQAAKVIGPLLQAGANPAFADARGETALAYAAAH
ncbi:MAG: ankyrin repeat domain-containing protein, partial [Sinobacteraceae bacterium]|nr:ankyrin repeat domain-containing protein [Nevskiaceae bacterium]